MTTKARTAQEMMASNTLVKHLAGSLAYGTNLPTSDVDYRGIFCADPINLLTPFFPVREVEDTEEEDTKLYELSHFMKLCLDCNPNIVETLWVEENDITFRTPAYDFLRQHRSELLSSKIAFTTSGYAIAQLKRIKGHNKWITNPQKEEPPRQCDYLSMVQYFGEEKVFKFDPYKFQNDHRLVPYGADIFGVYPAPGYQLFESERFTLNKNFDESNRHEFGAPLMIVKFNRREYDLKKEQHKNYWSWKNKRNEARSELEEEFGYDTKHAMHLVRLLRMGKEALEDGVIQVKRHDAQELLDIRHGKWTYEECVAYAENMDALIRNELYHKTSLPKRPNLHRAAEILMKTQEIAWKHNG